MNGISDRILLRELHNAETDRKALRELANRMVDLVTESLPEDLKLVRSRLFHLRPDPGAIGAGRRIRRFLGAPVSGRLRKALWRPLIGD